MVAAQRKLPSTAAGSSLPFDALSWQDKAHYEDLYLWRYTMAPLTGVGGTANAITATSDTAVVVAITAYAAGQKFSLVPTLTNTGGVTIAIDGLSTKSIVDPDSVALEPGALVANRRIWIEYDGTNFILIASGSGSSSSIPSSAPGLILRDEKTQNTPGGTFTSAAWQQRVLNAAPRNVITGASLTSNQFTLPAGTFYIAWSAPAQFCNAHQTRLQNITDATTVEEGTCETNAAAGYVTRSEGCTVVTISTPKVFELQHQCTTTRATDGFGEQANLTTEVYSVVYVWKEGALASEIDGIPGGAVTFKMTFSTTTTDADPGTGKIRLDNATQNIATTAYVDLSDANLTDITAILDQLNSSTNIVRGQLRLTKYDDPTKWLTFNMTSWTTASGYRKLTLVNIASSAASPFANNDILFFTFTRAGDVGLDGAVAIRYTFSTTTTDSDPGNGTLRLDNATQGSATTIRADLLDNLGTDWTAVLDTLDASSSGVKGQIRLTKANDPTKYITFNLASRATPSGYRNLTVAFTGQSGANPFANGDAVVFSFTRNGDKGDTGATGSVGTVTASSVGSSMINGTLVASVAANALTIAIKGQNGADPGSSNHVYVVMRNASPSSGSYDLVDLAAANSQVISSGSTMGAANGVPFKLWIILYNDVGTFRIGVVNCLNGLNIFPLGQFSQISVTAEGGAGAADSAAVVYGAANASGKSYTVLGYMAWESGLTTAGTWDAAPTRIQLFNPYTPLPGMPVQEQSSFDGAVNSGATTVPDDDTIPQNTEGNQFLSVSITPTSTANLLEVKSQVHVSSSSSNIVATSLHQDSAANALASLRNHLTGSGTLDSGGQILWRLLASTISSTTFKIRSGTVSGTTTFNGITAARKLGGVLNSFITVKEIMT